MAITYRQLWPQVISWQNLLAAIDLLPAGSQDGQSELAGLLSELRHSKDATSAAELATLAKHPAHRQQLQAE